MGSSYISVKFEPSAQSGLLNAIYSSPFPSDLHCRFRSTNFPAADGSRIPILLSLQAAFLTQWHVPSEDRMACVLLHKQRFRKRHMEMVQDTSTQWLRTAVEMLPK